MDPKRKQHTLQKKILGLIHQSEMLVGQIIVDSDLDEVLFGSEPREICQTAYSPHLWGIKVQFDGTLTSGKGYIQWGEDQPYHRESKNGFPQKGSHRS